MKRLILLFLFFLTVQVNGGLVVPGIVAQWKCNDANSQNAVVDAVSGNNGTYTVVATPTNLTSVVGAVKTAIDFSAGTTRWVDLGNLSSIGTVKSFAFWIKTSSATDAQGLIMPNGTNFGTNYIWLWNNDLLMQDISDEVFYINGELSATFSITNEWVFIVCTTATGTTMPDASLGSETSSLLGAIDNVMLFDRVLKAEEVKLLYNNGHGMEDIPVGGPRNRYEIGYRVVFRGRYR